MSSLLETYPRRATTETRVWTPVVIEAQIRAEGGRPPVLIALDHDSDRKRIDVEGMAKVEAERPASEAGDVQCGIPGYDHPGTELFGDVLESTDEVLEWHVGDGRRAAFATDFDYSS